MRCAILGLAAAVLIAAPALAQKKVFDPAALPDAEALIDSCYTPLKELYDSGVTGKMRQASVRNVICLKGVIINQVRDTFPDPDAAAARFETYFAQLGQGAMRIHWELFNETRYCSTQNCGTYRQLLHAGYHTGLLEAMLRDILTYRREEGF